MKQDGDRPEEKRNNLGEGEGVRPLALAFRTDKSRRIAHTRTTVRTQRCAVQTEGMVLTEPERGWYICDSGDGECK